MMDVSIEGLEAWVVRAEFVPSARFEPEQLSVHVRPRVDMCDPYEFLRRVVEGRTIVLCSGARWVAHTVSARVEAQREVTLGGNVLNVDSRPREMDVELICWPER